MLRSWKLTSSPRDCISRVQCSEAQSWLQIIALTSNLSSLRNSLDLNSACISTIIWLKVPLFPSCDHESFRCLNIGYGIPTVKIECLAHKCIFGTDIWHILKLALSQCLLLVLETGIARAQRLRDDCHSVKTNFDLYCECVKGAVKIRQFFRNSRKKNEHFTFHEKKRDIGSFLQRTRITKHNQNW